MKMWSVLAGALGALALAAAAAAQGPIVQPAGSGGSSTPGGTSGQSQYNNGGVFAGYTVGGDCTLVTSTGAIACLKTNGVSFGALATSTDAANLTGTVSVNRFNGGTNADSTHFLRGDGSWAVPAGGTGCVPPGAPNAILIDNGAGACPDSAATASAAGRIVTPAATTTQAMFNMPHGAAPTSPVNGDVWTTTSGIFVRINGVTVGPLSSGGAPTVFTGNPGQPAAVSSSSVYTLEGLANSGVSSCTCSIVVGPSGIVDMVVTGVGYNSTDATTLHGISWQLYAGTGTPPAFGTAVTGTCGTTSCTALGVTNQITFSPAPTASNLQIPFTATWALTGQTPGTTVWVDLGAKGLSNTIWTLGHLTEVLKTW